VSSAASSASHLDVEIVAADGGFAGEPSAEDMSKIRVKTPSRGPAS
jgi:hypothetical protein